MRGVRPGFTGAALGPAPRRLPGWFAAKRRSGSLASSAQRSWCGRGALAVEPSPASRRPPAWFAAKRRSGSLASSAQRLWCGRGALAVEPSPAPLRLQCIPAARPTQRTQRPQRHPHPVAACVVRETAPVGTKVVWFADLARSGSQNFSAQRSWCGRGALAVDPGGVGRRGSGVVRCPGAVWFACQLRSTLVVWARRTRSRPGRRGSGVVRRWEMPRLAALVSDSAQRCTITAQLGSLLNGGLVRLLAALNARGVGEAHS